MLQLVQGPPGTGKTGWTAKMVKICHVDSNAAANALLGHLVSNDQNIGYGVRALRFAGQSDEVNAMIALYRECHGMIKPDVPPDNQQPSTPNPPSSIVLT